MVGDVLTGHLKIRLQNIRGVQYIPLPPEVPLYGVWGN